MKILKHIICGIVGMVLSNELSHAQRVDYSILSVPEEKGVTFTRITSDGDYVCMPEIRRSFKNLNWFSSRILDISPDGKTLAFISNRNNCTNIFLKQLDKLNSSTQRTNRSNVLDVSFSPDGTKICFSEVRGKSYQIFQTHSQQGYACRQITNGNMDFSPMYSADMQTIFFARQETSETSIWSFNMQNNSLSNYTNGMNPYPIPGETAFLCARMGSQGRSEIWKVNYESGVEECLVSDKERDFTSPSLSPDGKWILFVGSSKISSNEETFDRYYWNTDIFVSKIDGTQFTQITYHAADDVSPVWSKDGEYIYFISQRGSALGIANVWKINFIY